MSTRTTLCSLALLVAIATPAAAGPTEDLAAILRAAAASNNPTLAFLRGVGDLGDVSLSAAQVRAAVRQAELPQVAELAQLLEATRTLTKRDDRITIERTRDTELSYRNDQGVVAGRVLVRQTVKVRLRLRDNGARAELDKISGIKVGEGADGRLYDLWEVVCYEQNGKQLADVTAGMLIFSKTITVDLTPTPEHSGMTSALGE